MLLSYVGEDATDAVQAFHRDNVSLQKFLTPLVVARVCSEPISTTGGKGAAESAAAPLHDPALEKDFRHILICSSDLLCTAGTSNLEYHMLLMEQLHAATRHLLCGHSWEQ